ncbi:MULTISPECIES: amino acid ABC transporter substrate-binding protein [Methanosphaera]|jgi:polar amino acid transport system substrate-binding protein|uniref:Predicted ABC-type polar amino acid transport system, periplasmic substrate-binding protein n=1 Tax=Methanosphaera stadtmanae (strain ATCC 43021 / DSM 3091 / JCM 11832 / MCB-3) TaxID=339860 RepID=Q2NFQ5_METST|nr:MULTISPECIES: amino acid ABC transporter substrate-binding protein [Methanosphaera]ABC57348.1 predicted ABC-type polar amino acid transport system, periplasmic substrate-binding protein [Methanosphaera stadtmanae DSM 3091]OEC92828.1 ABC transporter substrate-binding protein [Methanosphaera sp. A6]RAP47160.1 MAG: ABC transporter substrate-binding protein [Methanosphaera sp. DEW79]
MNKKIGIIAGVIVLIAIIAAVLVFTGVINTNGNTGPNDNVLVVGFDSEFPPYGYKDDNGEYVGFDLDLAQEVCNRNNWTLVKQPIDWDAKDSELSSGTIDCIWNGFTINGREDKYLWSKPYIDNKQVIVTKSNSGINSLSDLKGKQVETQKDSSALSALEGDQKPLADTFKQLVQIADYNTAFLDLDAGTCDAVAMDIGVAQYQVNSKSNPSDYKILDEEISSEQYGIGFKKGNEQLRDKIQQTLDEMEADGTIAKIASKYDSYGVPGSLIKNNNTTTNTTN